MNLIKIFSPFCLQCRHHFTMQNKHIDKHVSLYPAIEMLFSIGLESTMYNNYLSLDFFLYM